MISFSKSKQYAPALVRYAIGIVFLLIGISQLTNPVIWTAYLPESFAVSGIALNSIVSFTGIFNTLVGLLLILGLLVRTASAVAALHLISVIIILGYNDVSIRDLGLLLATISIFLNGADNLCLSKKRS
ncbi:hypothetical protein COU60_05110 [Candidatus Pacearchaeota archaeon CG10_big_fil_rev_8_21_14_0_10_34_76]|nr:MAG: hypothetical protein COU60_05110 [Candidatus Pacearchaeota archaeon CG10_big_fil_rev_8_21_14_0_10_34_76]